MRIRCLTRCEADQIRELYFQRRYKQTEIAAMYSITQGQVSKIVSDIIYA